MPNCNKQTNKQINRVPYDGGKWCQAWHLIKSTLREKQPQIHEDSLSIFKTNHIMDVTLSSL